MAAPFSMVSCCVPPPVTNLGTMEACSRCAVALAAVLCRSMWAATVASYCGIAAPMLYCSRPLSQYHSMDYEGPAAGFLCASQLVCGALRVGCVSCLVVTMCGVCVLLGCQALFSSATVALLYACTIPRRRPTVSMPLCGPDSWDAPPFPGATGSSLGV